mmetsp:Transcript_142861/g.397978  ORF Transcript_142861/g.397978 Transcript_142861/m.397978 type:complete len:192 (-) Transcript_142861:131-706(-)
MPLAPTGMMRPSKDMQTEPYLPGPPASDPLQDLIDEMKRENEAMEKQAKELQHFITLVADSHRVARKRQACLVAENMFLQELRTRLLRHSPNPPCNAPVNAARGAPGPLPREPADLQVLRMAMRCIMDTQRQQLDGRGLPPDVALAQLVRSAAQSVGPGEHATASWLQPLLMAVSAQEAASRGPDVWEDCD